MPFSRHWSFGRASSGTVLVALALPWVGERPVCVWGVLSSEILVQKPKQTNQFAVFLQKDFSRVSGNGNGYKKPPPKKKNQNCISMYIYVYLYRGHFAGTLCCTDLEISACLCLLHLLHRCSLCFRGKN